MCAISAGAGVTVSGTGIPSDPWVVSATGGGGGGALGPAARIDFAGDSGIAAPAVDASTDSADVTFVGANMTVHTTGVYICTFENLYVRSNDGVDAGAIPDTPLTFVCETFDNSEIKGTGLVIDGTNHYVLAVSNWMSIMEFTAADVVTISPVLAVSKRTGFDDISSEFHLNGPFTMTIRKAA